MYRLHVSLVGVLAADLIPERMVQASLMAENAVRFSEFDLVLNRVLSLQNMKEDKPLVLASNPKSIQSVNRLFQTIGQALSAFSGIKFSNSGSITPHLTLV